jgi:hypothetical protein
MPNGSHWSIGAVELEAVEAVFVSAHHGTRASAKPPRWGKGWVRVHCDLTSTSILSLSSLPFPFPLPLPSSTPLLLSSLLLYPPFSLPYPPSLCYHVQEVCFSQFCPSPLSSLFPANSSLAVSPGPSGGLLLPGLPPSPAAPCPSSPP